MRRIRITESDKEEERSRMSGSEVEGEEVAEVHEQHQQDAEGQEQAAKDPSREEGEDEDLAIPLEKFARVHKLVEKLDIPVINIDESPKPIDVLKFMREMAKFRGQNQTITQPILTRAFKGDIAKEWCTSADYNFDEVMRKLGEWLEFRQDWVAILVKLRSGDVFSTDLDMHIYQFKLIAEHAKFSLEDDVTKQCFIKSMAPSIQPALVGLGTDEKPATFDQLVTYARRGRKAFEEYARSKAKPVTKEEGAACVAGAAKNERIAEAQDAVAALSGERPRWKGTGTTPTRKVRCFVCGRLGISHASVNSGKTERSPHDNPVRRGSGPSDKRKTGDYSYAIE